MHVTSVDGGAPVDLLVPVIMLAVEGRRLFLSSAGAGVRRQVVPYFLTSTGGLLIAEREMNEISFFSLPLASLSFSFLLSFFLVFGLFHVFYLRH